MSSKADNGPSHSISEGEGEPPQKRARHDDSLTINGKIQNGHMSASASSATLPPLSLSILGVEPLDEFIREIADFVHFTILNRPEQLGGHIELEAKIGVLRDRSGGQRLSLPVLVETILAPDYADMRFESNMSPNQHKHFNTLLNKLMTSSLQPGHPSTPLKYTHLRLIDSFYPSENREKIRVTRDEKTGHVQESMKKIRLADLNIYSPKRAADWRISVSLEIPVPPPTGTSTHTRRKDRLSYAHEEFVIDLTQVTSSGGPNSSPEVLHELEVEVARPEMLLAAAAKRNDPNVPEHERYAFDELIRAFVNNARILVRNSSDGWH